MRGRLRVARQDGRIVQSKFLQISADVLRTAGVMFTADVSNKSGIHLMDFASAVEQLDFDVVYNRTDWKDAAIQARRQAAKKYEILVPKHVPINHILNLT